MPLGGAGRGLGHGGVDPVALDEQAHDVGVAGGAHADPAAARADGDDDVVGGGRAQHPHGACGGLLDALEQRIGALDGDAVGVLDDEHLVAAQGGAHGALADELAHLVDTDGQLLGAHERDIGVGARQGRAAVAAAAAAPRGALERGGEGAGRVGAPGAWRARDEPGVRHGVGAAGDGPAQGGDGVALADEVGPHAGEGAGRGGCVRLGDGPGLPGARLPGV